MILLLDNFKKVRVRLVFIIMSLLIPGFICLQSQNVFASSNPSNANEVYSDTQKEELYNKAKELIDAYEGDPSLLSQAREYLAKILEHDPNYALAYVGLGRIEYKKGYINYDNFEARSLKQAHEYIDKALTINPELPEAYFVLTYVYLNQKDYGNAKKTVEKLQKVKPNAVEINLLLAEIAEGEQNYDEAILRAKEAVAKTSIKKIKMDAYSIISASYSKKEDYNGAEEFYLAQLNLEPHSPWIKINYSGFLIKKGDYDKAIEFAKSALEEMDFGMGHHILAQGYYRRGVDLCWRKHEYEKAENDFKSTLEQDPFNADAYYGLGVCYRFIAYNSRNKEILEKSTWAFKKALEIDPSHKLAKEELNKQPFKNN